MLVCQRPPRGCRWVTSSAGFGRSDAGYDRRVAPVEIKVRENGPYKVTGPITLVDAEGNEFTLPDDGRPVALCRCGASTTKPFCDGTHSSQGFAAAERAVEPEGAVRDS